jgi:SAM-dependent methyltransferase
MNPQALPFINDLLAKYDSADIKILEIGCGNMRYKEILQGDYKGLDLPDSVYLNNRPDFMCGAEKIPVDSESFDLVFGVGVFYLIPKIHEALRECYRVLKPGGTLLIFDYQRHVLAEHMSKSPSDHYTIWDFEILQSYLVKAGFGLGKIVEYKIPSRFRILNGWPIAKLRLFRDRIFKKQSWLIAIAKK